MLKLAWKYMRYYKSQTLAILVSVLLTASLLSGISSLIYSSQKSDLANRKTIYGDWHFMLRQTKKHMCLCRAATRETDMIWNNVERWKSAMWFRKNF